MTAIVVALWVGCNGGTQDTFFTDTSPEEKPDREGPKINHIPVTDPVVIGTDVLVDATARDESTVFSMELHYRRETSVEWVVVAMNYIGDDVVIEGLQRYQGLIRGQDISSGGMYYYLTAVDNSDYQNESALPPQADHDPWRFPVTPE